MHSSNHFNSLNGSASNPIHISGHAVCRMNSRRFNVDILETVLEFGRVVYTRGASIHVIGKKEITRYSTKGINLSACEGIHVVCSTDEETIITMYKNKNFRGLRPRKRNSHFYKPNNNYTSN